MMRSRFEFVVRRATVMVTFSFVLIMTGACSFNTAPDNKPASAKIAIEGTTPNPLTLILSSNFFEQINLSTGQRTPVLITSDTVSLTLPYSKTLDISAFGSVYVEVYQPEVATATVHMKVDLDTGPGYDQNATLADKAQLIYYYVFSDYSHY